MPDSRRSGSRSFVAPGLEAGCEEERETRLNTVEEAITVAAADPLNLAGVVVPGERPAAVPGKTVTFLGGAVRVEEPSLAVTAI